MNRFLKVRCTECKNEQVIFSKASTPVKCLLCGNALSLPKGGKADVSAKIVNVYQ